jgi:hypothetical protein
VVPANSTMLRAFFHFHVSIQGIKRIGIARHAAAPTTDLTRFCVIINRAHESPFVNFIC